MQTMLLRVVSSGEMISVKSENGQSGLADLREGRTGVCDTEVPDARVQRTSVYGHRGNGNC